MPKVDFWDIVKGIFVMVISIGISMKLYEMPMTLSVDFSTLLSLFLAFFSVGLSVLFYFKATETSNTFYDNTYKFTRDLAQLMTKMESGFGEKLKNLDEGYSSMRGYFQNGSSSGQSYQQEVKQELEKDNDEVQKITEERNEIVKKLIESSKLHEDEKEAIAVDLKNKEAEIKQLQSKVSALESELAVESVHVGNVSITEERYDDTYERVVDYLNNYVIPRIYKELPEKLASPSAIKNHFHKNMNREHPRFISEMHSLGLMQDNALTYKGAMTIRDLFLKRQPRSA